MMHGQTKNKISISAWSFFVNCSEYL